MNPALGLKDVIPENAEYYLTTLQQARQDKAEVIIIESHIDVVKIRLKRCIWWENTHKNLYSDKRKQLLKMKFLVNEQNVSVMCIDITEILWYLILNIFQQDECFCSKLGMEVEYAKSNLKTALSQIWVICDLLPFVNPLPPKKQKTTKKKMQACFNQQYHPIKKE